MSASRDGGASGVYQLTPKATELHQTLQESLNVKDRANFARILDHYKRSNNVQRFVDSLNEICRTPQQKEEIYPLLRGFIPRKHRERFDYECSRPRSSHGRPNHETYSRKRLQKPQHYYTTRSLPEDYANRWANSSVDSGFETPVVNPSSRKFETRTQVKKENNVKKQCVEKLVLLDRDEDAGELFGFSIRGGAEHNVALFVSSIDKGSLAEEAGLILGDQIMQANQIDFGNIFHKDAVEVIKQASTLYLLVKSVGKIPGTYKTSSSYRWIDPMGNEVSPPPEYTKANLLKNDMNKSDMRLLGGDDERKVNLFVADGAELGLKIRGGIEHGLGIFIASVDPDSGAERAGFQVGDQILDVNGKNFVNISHLEAVKALKSSQHMVITLKDLGILPHGKKVHDETKWIKEAKNSPRPPSADSSKKTSKTKKIPSFHEPMGSSLLTHHSVADHSEEILKIKARKVLTYNELQSFGFYLDEYRMAHLSLISFLSALTDLLKTPDKISLFQEIRIAILPRDLSKLDEWMDKRADQLSKVVLNQHRKQDGQSLCSYKSSDSSTNSWFGFFKNDDRSRLKSSSRDKFDRLPDPPEELLQDHSWEVASTGSRSSRARRAMPFDDFPPPPIFIEQNRTSLDSCTSNSPQEIERTVSPSGIRLEYTEKLARNGERHVENRVETSRDPDKTSPRSLQGTAANGMSHDENTEDRLYEDVDNRYTRGSSKNETSLTMNVPVRGRLEHVDRKEIFDTVNNSSFLGSTSMYSHTIDDKDAEDGTYTVVKHRDTWGSSRGNISSEHDFQCRSVQTNKDNKVLQENVTSTDNEDQIPIYSTVDKTNRENKLEDLNSFLDQNNIPPPVPDRLYMDSDTETLESNPKLFPNDAVLVRNEFSNQNLPERPKHTAPLEGFDPESSKRATNGHSNEPPELNSSPEGIQSINVRLSQDNTRNVGSTKRIKKAKRSKTNIAEVTQEVDPDKQSQPFVVEIGKYTSNLGLSITGGTDTESKEIRIKSVKGTNTVAGSCPLLKPGQIILGVDEKSLMNVTSGIAAMAIKQAFHSDKTVLKLILENDS